MENRVKFSRKGPNFSVLSLFFISNFNDVSQILLTNSLARVLCTVLGNEQTISLYLVLVGGSEFGATPSRPFCRARKSETRGVSVGVGRHPFSLPWVDSIDSIRSSLFITSRFKIYNKKIVSTG